MFFLFVLVLLVPSAAIAVIGRREHPEPIALNMATAAKINPNFEEACEDLVAIMNRTPIQIVAMRAKLSETYAQAGALPIEEFPCEKTTSCTMKAILFARTAHSGWT